MRVSTLLYDNIVPKIYCSKNSKYTIIYNLPRVLNVFLLRILSILRVLYSVLISIIRILRELMDLHTILLRVFVMYIIL